MPSLLQQDPIAAAEAERLSALDGYGLLDSPADSELEAIVRVAAALAGVPTATLNLIDEDRQCQLTTVGFDGADSPRSESMCARHFLRGQVVVVPDARLDSRFADSSWVTGVRASVRFYASAPIVNDQGHALGTLCVFSDVPQQLGPAQAERLADLAQVVLALFERRRQARENLALALEAEQQRERAASAVQELERSNTELEQFAAIAGHDLSAPLTVVSGYIELVRDVYRERLDDRALSWVDTSLSGVARMRALISALLSYAGAGAVSCRYEDVPLGDVVDLALADLGTSIAEADAEIEVRPGLPDLSCDPTLMRQLLQNLLGNALKYRRTDRPCRIVVRAERRVDAWLVAVEDNGVGIPPEHRERVFGVFERVPDAPAKGHGIGLATCRRIVDRHGGTIRVSGSDSGGTVVSFSIPIRAGSNTA